MNQSILRVGLASKGSYEEATNRFLAAAGLPVVRPNSRQYIGSIGGLDSVEVLFQRPEDIVHKVADGTIDIGITGYDLVAEYAIDDPNVFVVIEDLGFRRCELVLAIPDYWLDIQTIDDLADLAVRYKRDGRELRIATKFQNLTTEFLFRQGINYFSTINAAGALEAAPGLGYADVIADLTQSGVTLRDNRLRVLDGGVILKAQACLIGNLKNLASSPALLERSRGFIELIEASLQARQYMYVTGDIRGVDEQEIVRRITADVSLAGERGPTIAPVYAKDGTSEQWFAVSLIIRRSRVHAAVDHLRAAGAAGVTVQKTDYMFGPTSSAFDRLKINIDNPRH